MCNTTLKDFMNSRSSSKSSREFLRTRNRRLILNVIDKKGPVSRQDIVRLTGIRPATVINYVEKSIKEGFINEIGPGKSTGGRKPILLELNPQAAFAVGVHLAETRIIAVIVDLRGNVVTQIRKKVSISKGKNHFIETTLKTIEQVTRKSKLNINKIIGIGIGVPGLVDSEKGISLFCTLRRWWRDIHFKEIVEKKFAIPTFVENDTRVLTLGERWFGLGKKVKSFFYLEAGEGIALGTFLNGELYSGVGGSAGELGHTIIDKNGPLCKCGNHGCLEALASTVVIEEKMKKLLKQGVKSKIQQKLGGSSVRLSFSNIVKAARENDKAAIRILEESANYLGIAVANVVNLLNPGLIIVGGLIAEAGDIVLEPLKVAFKKHALSKPANEVDIHLTQLDESAGALGAATLVLEKFFKMS